MLVVAASAAFTVTAGFSGSFTEPETGKSASSTPNQGVFLFIYPEEKEEKEGEKKDEAEERKRCHLWFFSKMIAFPRAKDQQEHKASP